MHGYDNPWPAGGGANKWDEEWENGKYDTNSGIEDEAPNQIRTKNLIPVIGSAQYFAYTPRGSIWALFYDASENLLTGITIDDVKKQKNAFNITNKSFTMPAEAAYMKFYMSTTYGTTYNNNIAINYPATVTTYSPYSNICPISGHTGAEIEQTGANVWDEEFEHGNINNSTGELVPDTSLYRSKNVIPVKGDSVYYLAANSNYNAIIYWYDKEMNYLGYIDQTANSTRTAPSNAYYARLRFFSNVTNMEKGHFSINYPATDTEYHPYTGTTIPITWQSEAGTVYSGTLDVVSGKMYVTSAKYVFDGTQTDIVTNWRSNADSVGWLYLKSITPGISVPLSDFQIPNLIADKLKTVSYAGSDGIYYATIDCISIVHQSPTYGIAMRSTDTSLTTVSAINAFLAQNPVTVVYELAQPVEYTITANELTTLYGQNNVWTDTGDVTVTYIANAAKFSFGSPLHTYNYVNLKLFGNTYIEHGKG